MSNIGFHVPTPCYSHLISILPLVRSPSESRFLGSGFMGSVGVRTFVFGTDWQDPGNPRKVEIGSDRNRDLRPNLNVSSLTLPDQALDQSLWSSVEVSIRTATGNVFSINQLKFLWRKFYGVCKMTASQGG